MIKTGYLSKTHQSIILALLSLPIMSIPIIFYEIYRQKWYALYYLAFVMSIFAFLWSPTGDLYHYTQDYYILSLLTFDQFLEELTFDCVLQSVMYAFARSGIEFQYVRFCLCFTCYLMMFSVFKDAIKRTTFIKNKANVFMMFIVLYCFLRFGAFLTGVRFQFGMALCYYGFYKQYVGNKIGWLFLILACFTHFSLWGILFIALLSKIHTINLSRSKLLAILLLLFFSMHTILASLIDYLPISDLLKSHLAYYTEGYYASGELDDHSFKFRLAQIFGIIGVYVMFLISVYRIKIYKEYRFFSLCLIWLVLMWNMNSAFNRYAFLSIILFTMIFIMNPGSLFRTVDLKVLCYTSVFVFATSIYTVRKEMRLGYQLTLLYQPVPLAFTHIYSPEWISNHVFKSGNFK